MARATPTRRWAMRALAVPVGAAVSLVFPEANLWWLAYVGLVPVLALVVTAADRADALWRSWAAGTGFFLGLFHWLLPVLGPFVPFPALAMGATWIPIGWAAWATLGPPSSARSGPVRAATALAVVPSVWVLVEVVRSWQVFGGSWGFLGLSQWEVGAVLPIAALGGVWALSWVLVAVNVGLVAVVVADRDRATAAVALGLPVGLLVAGIAWGAAQTEPEPTGVLRVAGVQPGRIDDGEARLAANEALTDGIDAAGDGIDLVVWGQSSVAFDPVTDAGARQRLEAVTDRAGVPVLVNVDARRPDGRIAKSSVLFEPGAGMVATYDKQRLVPFGEYIPLRPLFGWVARFTDAATEDRVPGVGLTVFDIDGVAVGPLISFESTFPDLRRSVARLGVDVMVVQGVSTTFQGSWAQPQQASFEAIRAVESGRATILVAVSGTTAAFDARGRQLAWLPSDETGVIVVDLPLAARDTPFVRWGDWVPIVSALLAAGWLADELRRRLRHREMPSTDPTGDTGAW